MKKVALRNCVDCGFPVSGGGNRHAADRHVPRGKRGDRYHSLSPKRESAPIGTQILDTRGVSVAGVGGGQAKSHRQGKKASKAKLGKGSVV